MARYSGVESDRSVYYAKMIDQAGGLVLHRDLLQNRAQIVLKHADWIFKIIQPIKG